MKCFRCLSLIENKYQLPFQKFIFDIGFFLYALSFLTIFEMHFIASTDSFSSLFFYCPLLLVALRCGFWFLEWAEYDYFVRLRLLFNEKWPEYADL